MIWLLYSYLFIGAISAFIFWKTAKTKTGWKRVLDHTLHVVAWPIGFIGVVQLARAITKVNANEQVK